MRITDDESFTAYVAARTPALSRTAYLLCGDAHHAQDLVQSALFQAAKAWHRIEGDPEPYVRRILYTQNVSRWRRRKVAEVALGTLDRPDASRDPVTVPVATVAIGLAGAIGDRWWRGRGIGLALSVPLSALGLFLWLALT